MAPKEFSKFDSYSDSPDVSNSNTMISWSQIINKSYRNFFTDKLQHWPKTVFIFNYLTTPVADFRLDKKIALNTTLKILN